MYMVLFYIIYRKQKKQKEEEFSKKHLFLFLKIKKCIFYI